MGTKMMKEHHEMVGSDDMDISCNKLSENSSTDHEGEDDDNKEVDGGSDEPSDGENNVGDSGSGEQPDNEDNEGEDENDEQADDEDNEGDGGFDQQGDYDANEQVADESDQQDDDDEKQSEDDILLEVTYVEEKAIEQLSAVFKLLKIDPIHDK
jgi:hypothetical protein